MFPFKIRVIFLFFIIIVTLSLADETLKDEMCAEHITTQPRSNDYRKMLTLDGIWNYRAFTVDDHELIQKGIVFIPSNSFPLDEREQFNGILEYSRSFFLPMDWEENQFIYLRFGGIPFNAKVFVNSNAIGKTDNSIYLKTIYVEPEILIFGQENLISIQFDYNRKGKVVDESSNEIESNFVGIQQSLILFTIQQIGFISYVDVRISDEIECKVDFYIEKFWDQSTSSSQRTRLFVTLIDSDNNEVTNENEFPKSGSINLKNCNLWYPVGMENKTIGYLYTLRIRLALKNGEIVDEHFEKFGFRTIAKDRTKIRINGEKLYSFGMNDGGYEKGAIYNAERSLAIFENLNYLNANLMILKSLPSDEFLDLADQLGIMIIIEINFSESNDATNILKELICYSGNHASIIMWHLGDNNNRIRELIDVVHDFDPNRLIAATLNDPEDIENNPVIRLLDVVFVDYDSIVLPTNKTFILEVLIDMKKSIVLNSFGERKFYPFNRIHPIAYNELSDQLDILKNVPQKTIFSGEVFGYLNDHVHLKGNNPIIRKGVFDRAHYPKDIANKLRRFNLRFQKQQID